MNVPALPAPCTTLVDVLRWRAKNQPDQVAYTFLANGEVEDATVTYAELDRRARALGALLQDRGARGERVLLLYPPGLDYAVAVLGCLYAGAVAVPAYPPDPARLARTLPRLLALVADAQVSIALTTKAILQMGDFLFEGAPELKSLSWLATDEMGHGDEDRLAAAWRSPSGTADTLAILQYTSGSTAAPRGVMLTHENLLHNSAAIYRCFGHSAASRGVIWLPPYHDMGLIGGVLQPLYGGFPVVLMSPIDFVKRPLRWLRAISRYRATTSGGPNFAYDLCVRKIAPEERASLDLSSWELAFNGAEPIAADTLDRFLAAFGPCGFRREAFYPCYGLAEATLIVSGGEKRRSPVIHTFQRADLERHQAIEAPAAGPPGDTVVSLVGCGQSLPDQTILVVDPESLEPLPPGRVGEICVSGESVAQGYWNRPELSAQTFRASLPARDGSFLRTGDLGFSWGGELFVTGRSKDLIIIRGRNHYPQDIELTAERSHAAVRRGCSAAFSVAVAGEERLFLAAEVDTSKPLDAAAVIEAMRSTVASQHEVQVHTVVLLKPGAIPKTSSGKIQRRACRAGVLSGELEIVAQRSEAPGSDPSEMLDGAAQRPQLTSPQPTWPQPTSQERWLPGGSGAKDASPPRGQAEPRTPVEATLVEIWQEVLGSARIGAHDSFFALGGDSLSAIQVSGRIEERLGLDLPLQTLFEHPTVAGLAAAIASAKAAAEAGPGRHSTPPLERADERPLELLARIDGLSDAEVDALLGAAQTPAAASERRAALRRICERRSGAPRILPLSFAQERLWFLDRLEPNSALYNIPAAARARGPLDADALARSFQEIARRHEALRTAIVTVQGQPYQVIAPGSTLALPLLDLSGLSEAERGAEVERRTADAAQRPFDLAQGPLLRTELLRLGEQDHVLIVTLHHIVADGWSVGVLLKELAALYAAFQRGGTARPAEPPVQYGDFAVWQRRWLGTSAREDQLAYWKRQLHGAPRFLDLPTDRPRPPVQRYRGASQLRLIPGELWAALEALSLRAGVTPFMTLLAAFQTLLGRYAGAKEICVGTPVAGRGRAELEGLIGFFVNTLVLRTDLSGDPTFLGLLERVRETTIGAYEHQDVPFEQVVDALQPPRDPSRTPLFQVAFGFQNAPLPELMLGEVVLSPIVAESTTAKFDLSVMLSETANGWQAHLEYNTDLFDSATITRMAERYLELLASAAAHPERPLSELTAPIAEEAAQRSPAPREAPDPAPAAPLTQEHVAPRTPLEATLAEIWREVLGVERVGVHDSFFALGGNSLYSVLVLAKIQDSLHVELPVHRLFEAPTLAGLAASIEAATAARPVDAQPGSGPDARASEAAVVSPAAPWSPLVVIEPGDRARRPFFCVHPVGGNVLCYAELARRLGSDQPFYALAAAGLDGEQAPSATIESMATVYVRSVRAAQPAGPYAIGGWSMGGLVAFEMARQLRQAGERVDLLALIDSYAGLAGAAPPSEDPSALIASLFAEDLARLATRGLGSQNGHAPRGAPEGPSVPLAPVHAEGGATTPENARLVHLRRVFESNVRASWRYVPLPYDGAATLFRAADGLEVGGGRRDNGWGGLVTSGLEVVEIPGDHYTIMSAPHVQPLAERLRRCLATARREARSPG